MVKQTGDLTNITFVIHNIEGGVTSMNHQIIENAAFQEHFRVHILLWRAEENPAREMRYSFRQVDSIRHFTYSRQDNYYHTLRRFQEALNQWPGIIVTNDGMELEAIRKFGTRSVLFSIVHDFYNLKLAIENLDIVDYYLCHTEVFTRALLSSHYLNDRVGFLLHGVKAMFYKPSRGTEPSNKLRLLSISRLTESKGVMDLYTIQEMLAEKGIGTEWVIVGSGELEKPLKEQWKGKEQVRFCQPETPEEVYAIAQDCDIFISPSNFEGYGIALLEAMSCSLVPVIYQLPVGVYASLPEQAGFSLPVGDLRGMADRIARLHQDRGLLREMGRQANQLVQDRYTINDTARAYLQFFLEHPAAQTDKVAVRKQTFQAGLLDSAYMPNRISRLVRRTKSLFSK